jgi:hypothetical protein
MSYGTNLRESWRRRRQQTEARLRAAIGGFYPTLATSKACVLDNQSELALLTVTSTDDLL